MMNQIVRSEKRPGTSLGCFTPCLSSEYRRNEWWCPVSNSVQSMERYKICGSLDGSKCDETTRRLYNVDVPTDQNRIGYDGVLEVPADIRNRFAIYQGNGTGDACGSHLRSMRNGCTIDLNEPFPNDEPSPQAQNTLVGTSSSFGGSFPGYDGWKGSALPEISWNNTTLHDKSPHSKHGKEFPNSNEWCGKKKIFGVDISEHSPSKNGCFKLLGFTVLVNQREPQGLHSSSSSPSKSSSPASLLFGDATAKPLSTDHMFIKPEEKQLVNSFSSSPASVLSYSGKSGNAESFRTNHIFHKPASVNRFSNSMFLIDLNSCAEESEEGEEVRLEPSSPRNRCTRIEIDLEAPACPDPETSRSEGKSSVIESSNQGEDATVVAAEALLYISSYLVDEESGSNLDVLCWLIDVISSQELGLASRVKDEACSDDSIPGEMDYFEYMTLKQPETAVEEPEDISQVCKNLRAQSIERKLPQSGQGRRGRRPRKKDFQRDVLPMLASLSRNEAVDDLRVVGDLIRNRDGKTQSGLTRLDKTGSGLTHFETGSDRGRKRPVNGFEEKGIVVGWGKRTRRPQRQSCMSMSNVNAHPVMALD